MFLKDTKKCKVLYSGYVFREERCRDMTRHTSPGKGSSMFMPCKRFVSRKHTAICLWQVSWLVTVMVVLLIRIVNPDNGHRSLTITFPKVTYSCASARDLHTVPF